MKSSGNSEGDGRLLTITKIILGEEHIGPKIQKIKY